MCNMDKELLYSYADNSIEPLEKIFVEEHLKYCSQCAHELEEIKNTDLKLSGFNFEDIDFPERLSVLRQLIIDNCIEEQENEDPELKYNNYKESLKVIKNSAVESYAVRHNNPYDRMIKNNVSAAANVVKKAAKKYCKSKLEKSRIYKILKAV